MKHITVCEHIPILALLTIFGKLSEAENRYAKNRGIMKGDIDSKNTAVQNLVNYTVVLQLQTNLDC